MNNKPRKPPKPKSPEVDNEEKKQSLLEEALFYDRKRGQQSANQKRHLEAERNYLECLREISGNRISIAGTCPCGKHKGMRFFNECTPTSEVMCPTRVYMILVRKGNRERTSWALENPFTEWGKAMGVL